LKASVDRPEVTMRISGASTVSIPGSRRTKEAVCATMVASMAAATSVLDW
jgi:hypothetical protein